MRASLALWWVMGACVAPEAVEFHSMDLGEGSGMLRGGFNHVLDAPMVPGGETTFTVFGAAPGENVYLIRSFRGLGVGPCPDVIGGSCMGISAPLEVLASGPADADGLAVFSLSVPLTVLPGREIATQAVVVRGAAGEDSVLSAPRLDPVVAEGPILLSDGLIDFGTVPPGCDPAAPLMLKNVGSEPLTITRITSLDPDYFRVTFESLPITIEPGETDYVLVQADVESGIPYVGEVRIESDSTTGPVDVSVSAIGDITSVCPNIATAEPIAQYRALDMALVLDTTSSMGETSEALADQFIEMRALIAETVPDLTFGVATFEDYNDSTFGSGADKPFRLETQQTRDEEVALDALEAVELRYGYDLPESTLEALHQAMAGQGYDQDCDGRYDFDDDVIPLIDGPGDAFDGAVRGAYDASVFGTGDIGGMGFRPGTPTFIVYATDAEIRDPLAGYDSPGGCPSDANQDDVVADALGLGAKLVAILSDPENEEAAAQMDELAELTGSLIDDGYGGTIPARIDFDGDVELLGEQLAAQVRDLIPDFADFDEPLYLVVEEDPDEIVVSISPESVESALFGDMVPFDVELDAYPVEVGGAGVSMASVVLYAGEERLDRFEIYGVRAIED